MEQRSKGGVDAPGGRSGLRRQPPASAAFAERNLGIIDAAAAASNHTGVLCVPNGTTSGHQLVDQFLAELFGNPGSDARHRRPSMVMKAVFGGALSRTAMI